MRSASFIKFKHRLWTVGSHYDWHFPKLIISMAFWLSVAVAKVFVLKSSTCTHWTQNLQDIRLPPLTPNECMYLLNPAYNNWYSRHSWVKKAINMHWLKERYTLDWKVWPQTTQTLDEKQTKIIASWWPCSPPPPVWVLVELVDNLFYLFNLSWIWCFSIFKMILIFSPPRGWQKEWQMVWMRSYFTRPRFISPAPF